MRSVYRLLLHLYPRTFRTRYGDELLQVLDSDRAARRAAMRPAAVRFWLHALSDLVITAARQRYRSARTAYLEATGGGAPRLPHHSRRQFMETLVQDVRYACRQFVRRPGFTAIAVLSLALGIGGNSIIYGLLDGFVFNPFAYPDADRLVAIGTTFPKVSSDTTYVETLSPPEYEDIRRLDAFSHVAAFDLGNRNLSGGDVPERVFTAFLLADLFPVLGMRPLLGRGFTAEELAPNGPRAAVISHRLWQSRFAGDPRILERTIRIGGEPTAVVGVMPPELVLIATDLWMPWASMGADPASVPRNVRQFTVLARLAPGVSRRQANAELQATAARVQQAESARFREYEGWRLTATPWATAMTQDLRPAAFMLLVAVALVLLIACANLANLMLARATTRTRELAVRLALGAARWRIARQLLTESVMLAVAGAVGGVLLAYVALQFAQTLVPTRFQTLGLEARVNVRVLAWSAGATILAGVLVALLPMLQATRTDPNDSLKSEGRTGASRGGNRMRQALITAEIALSVVLLLGAGLLTRSVINVQRTELGFDPRGVLTMRLTLPREKYRSSEAVTTFFETLSARVQATPGVTGAGMASQFPPGGISNAQIEVEGAPSPAGVLRTSSVTVASRGYFATVRIPLMRGRYFDTTDTPASPDRVIVNQAFVTQFMGDRDPLLTRIRAVGGNKPGPWTQVVGVVGNARNSGATAPVRPEVFVPMEQGRDGWNQLFLLVRTEGDPAAILPQVRAVVAAIDSEQPIYAIQSMEDALALSSFQFRVAATLLGLFAGVALVMSAIGIYGVMSYAVSARTQEIGVRIALGAERGDVLRLVLVQVARIAALGTAIGIGLLVAGGKALSQLLYGVNPSDPLTIAAVTLTLGGVALVAGWIPAWKASRVNPIEALRYE